MSLRTSVTLAAGVLLLASHTLGQSQSTAGDKAAAQALFDQGSALMAQGEFQTACPKLEASLERFDGIGTRGKLAQCYEKVGRLASAWAMYREVDALASKTGDTRRASVARDAAKALEPRVPHLTISVPEANRIEGIVVRRDGSNVDTGAWGSAIAVDPGKHQIEASAAGFETWTKEIDLSEAGSESVEVPALVALPPEKQGTTQPDDQPGAPKQEPAATPWRPVAMVAVGVGVVSLGVGGYFGLRAKSKWSSAFDDGHCDSNTNTCDSTGQAETDQARSAAALSNVFIGAGAVLAVGGVALWLLGPKEKQPESTGLAVVPLAGRDRGGVWVSGSF